jgi:hypothetical protein
MTPKNNVMFIPNLLKITGCLMMLASLHPVIVYAMTGFGAAACSSSKVYSHNSSGAMKLIRIGRAACCLQSSLHCGRHRQRTS